MPHTGSTPKIVLSPAPRTVEEIFQPVDLERLQRLGELVIHEGMAVNEDLFERSFASAEIVIGQLDLPESRLRRMPGLKAIFNVEGNFLRNIDYQYCFSHGIRVLSISPVFAEPVAELALGLAIDLLRGITPSHCDFTNGVENYGLAANREAFSLFHQPVGFVSFGDLAKALLPLLSPFRCCLLAFDPWLPEEIIEQAGCKACSLDELLSWCRVIFVVASATSENEGLLGERQFARMQPGSAVILLSRAAVVDFDAMIQAAERGHIRAAADVFPVEPLAVDHAARRNRNLLLPHSQSRRFGEDDEENWNVGCGGR